MNHRLPVRLLSALLVLLAPAASVAAQNRDHPGLVPLGDGAWGTPDEARERGLIEYRGRWYPQKLERQLEKWERLDAKGLAWEDAYKERTKYYRVRTNVPRFLFHLEIAPFLDGLGDTYTSVFKQDFGLKGKAVKNKDLKIYGSFEEYSLHEGDPGAGRPRSNPGFIVNGSELVVFYEETDPALLYTTIFHEGAHQFFLSLLPGASLPIWLDEALATWFEGGTYSRVSQEITFGDIPAARLLIAQDLLADSSGTPEDLFMDVPRESFDAYHYSLAWSFLHYLLRRPGEDNTKKFARFLDEANGSGSKPLPEVFAKATGEDLSALAPGWRPHVAALSVPQDSVQWVSLTVASGEEDVRDGDLVWSVDGHEVYSPDQFEDLWRARSKERPTELVLVRCDPSFGHPYAKHAFVRTSIAPDSKASIRTQGGFSRHANLRD